MKTRLYKKKYLIAVYDQNDDLVTVCENAKDFAEFFERTEGLAHSILSRLFLKKRKSFFHNKKRLHIRYIEDEAYVI